MKFLSENIVPLGIILLSFVISLKLALMPLNFLLNNTIPDDSFYYFQIARNIAQGFGSTFDGVNTTNGYHPLWMALIVPLFKYFSIGGTMDLAPIHAALVLASIFNMAIGFVILMLVSRYTENMWIKSAALASLLLNPFNIYHMVDGLETSLSLLMVAMFFLAALRYADRRSYTSLLIAGVVGGLMMLSRLDNVFYFVMFLIWFIYDLGFRESVRKILFVGCVATAVVLPWLTFNIFSFGMIFTSSSAATTLINHRIIVQDHGLSIAQQLKAVIFMTDYTIRQFVVPQTGAPSVYFTLLGLTFGLLLFVEGRLRAFFRDIPMEMFLAAGFVLMFIANASIRWSPREWYFVGLELFIALWIAWLLEVLRQAQKLKPAVAVVVALFVASLYYISWSKSVRNQYTLSNETVIAAQWTNENLPHDAIIGSFNAGMVGYFSSHRVVNLDGLVNNAAYYAIADRRIIDYIRSENIEYIVDFGTRIQYRMESSLGVPSFLEEMEVVHETENGPTVYKVI